MGEDSTESAAQMSAVAARARDRFPIFALMQFIPMDLNGELLSSNAMRVVGKDLSTTGIAFTHDVRLPSRRAVVAVTDPRAGRLLLEVEVLWSRLSPIGQYESGCRLVRKITPARSSTPIQTDA